MYTPVYRVELVRERRLEILSKKLGSPDAAAKILYTYFRKMDREAVVVLGLTTKQTLIGIQTVSVGTLDQCIVHPREVFKPALLMNAAAVIVAHNHPSGEPEPSPEDCAVTRRLISAGEALGIELCDHIVIGEDSFVSLRQRGIWEQVRRERDGDASCARLNAQANRTARELVESLAEPCTPSHVRQNAMRFVALSDESYEHVATDGTLRAWNVTEGNRIAANGHELMAFPLTYHGVTPAKVLALYDGLDEDYAMNTDLTRPLLFIPFFGESLLIDGWHRLYQAAVLGIEELPMYLLTQEEADAICWLTLPAGGLQRDSAC